MQRVRLRPGWWLPPALVLLVSGCTSVADILEDAAAGDIDDRREAILDLEERIRKLRPARPRDAEARARIDQFLIRNFSQERDSVLREQYISLALQGKLPGAVELLQQGVADPNWNVRLTAVKGLGLLKPPETRQLLTDVLAADSALIVRIEAAKSFRYVGSADWARPLIEVLLDEAEDSNLRRQAWISANALTGKDLPHLQEPWRRILESEVP